MTSSCLVAPSVLVHRLLISYSRTDHCGDSPSSTTSRPPMSTPEAVLEILDRGRSRHAHQSIPPVEACKLALQGRVQDVSILVQRRESQSFLGPTRARPVVRSAVVIHRPVEDGCGEPLQLLPRVGVVFLRDGLRCQLGGSDAIRVGWLNLCVFGDVGNLVQQVFRRGNVGGHGQLEEASDPPGKLGGAVAFQLPGRIDDRLDACQFPG